MMSVLTFLAKRFVAGQTLAQALDVVEKFNRRGFMTTLDHLGEDVASVEEANAAAEQYIAILRALKKRGLDRNISIKLTQIGLAIDKDLCAKNLTRIVKETHNIDGFVRVDMERSTHVPKEPPDIAHRKRQQVDRAFLDLMKRLLTANTYNAIATHDQDLIDATKAFAKNNRVERDSFEFQMLMGIRPMLQRRLRDEGWRVRIYIPFGRHWLPYIWRRIRERKENVWFVIKNLFRW
jgi:proline dehydrogenase